MTETIQGCATPENFKWVITLSETFEPNAFESSAGDTVMFQKLVVHGMVMFAVAIT